MITIDKHLAGIVSWGIPCAINHPGLTYKCSFSIATNDRYLIAYALFLDAYTRVYSYIRFIKGAIKAEQDAELETL